MRKAIVFTVAAALVAAACGGGAVPTKAPSPTAAVTATPASTTAITPSGTGPGSPTASGEGLHLVLAGKDLCALLTVDDFTAAGVNGAATVSENNTNNEFYCVYAGRSSANGRDRDGRICLRRRVRPGRGLRQPAPSRRRARRDGAGRQRTGSRGRDRCFRSDRGSPRLPSGRATSVTASASRRPVTGKRSWLPSPTLSCPRFRRWLRPRHSRRRTRRGLSWTR